LLGLKGQISELELHTIRARLTAGLLNKAERGELAIKLPVGLVRDPSGVVQKTRTVRSNTGWNWSLPLSSKPVPPAKSYGYSVPKG